jgi:hypothetical protein
VRHLRPTNGPLTQQGVAPRIETTDGAVERAICIMKNIWGGGNWLFSAIGSRSGFFIILGSVDLSAEFDAHGSVPSLPWRMCSRVQGAPLVWKVWPTAEPEPDWDDSMFGTRITISLGWVYEGQPGFYVRHLESGGLGAIRGRVHPPASVVLSDQRLGPMQTTVRTSPDLTQNAQVAREAGGDLPTDLNPTTHHSSPSSVLN